MMDLPPLPVPVACVRAASGYYRLPPLALVGILEAEGGKPGVASRNRDGSEDLGPMQINSRWLPMLTRYGLTREKLLKDPCANVWAGAWILARSYARDGDVWTAIGHYHSWKKGESRKYRRRVARILRRNYGSWLLAEEGPDGR
ncbi:MAG: lytic transglycosylase domain-containing protein [Nitrospirae bacterium]|nr:lytic transglycosylase domain-containing protein [Nitrospirota bacterium]MCL5284203.1 lytic transglycosylase domain-containing protein [Nitrospirota bacterium]